MSTANLKRRMDAVAEQVQAVKRRYPDVRLHLSDEDRQRDIQLITDVYQHCRACIGQHVNGLPDSDLKKRLIEHTEHIYANLDAKTPDELEQAEAALSAWIQKNPHMPDVDVWWQMFSPDGCGQCNAFPAFDAEMEYSTGYRRRHGIGKGVDHAPAD